VAEPDALGPGQGVDQPEQRGAGAHQDPAQLLLGEAVRLLDDALARESRERRR